MAPGSGSTSPVTAHGRGGGAGGAPEPSGEAGLAPAGGAVVAAIAVEAAPFLWVTPCFFSAPLVATTLGRRGVMSPISAAPSLMRMGWLPDVILLAVIVGEVLLAPYTKVEESFNMQAMHDLLYIGPQLDSYDHVEFPGVVPRSFLGAITVASVSSPAVFAAQFLGLSKWWSQVVVRIILGLLSWLALCGLGDAMARRGGITTRTVFLLAAASTPHLCFYASRALPNTLAMALVTYGVGELIDSLPSAKEEDAMPDLMDSSHGAVIGSAAIAAAAVWLRCDVIVLAAPLMLWLVILRRLSLSWVVFWGLTLGAAALIVTLAVDSVLWSVDASSASPALQALQATMLRFEAFGRSWVWPEGTVLSFNAIQNRSAEWGTEPWHWYFTSALPRTLVALLPFLFLGTVRWLANARSVADSDTGIASYLDPATDIFAVPSIAFVGLYSILPHKETRFLLPVLPLLLATAAHGLFKVTRSAAKLLCCARPGEAVGPITTAVAWIPRIVVLAMCAVMTGIFVATSRLNYAGGHAFAAMHDAWQAGITKDSSAAFQSINSTDTLFTFPQGSAWSPGVLIDASAPATLALLVESLNQTDPALRHSWRSSESLDLARHARVHQVWAHIDVGAAMTGVTRFGEDAPPACAVALASPDGRGQGPELQGAMLRLYAMLATELPPNLRSALGMSSLAASGRSPRDGTCWWWRYSKQEEMAFPRDFAQIDWVVTTAPNKFLTEFAPVVAAPGVNSITMPRSLADLQANPWTLGFSIDVRPQVFVLARVKRSASFADGPARPPSAVSAGNLRGPVAVEGRDEL